MSPIRRVLVTLSGLLLLQLMLLGSGTFGAFHADATNRQAAHQNHTPPATPTPPADCSGSDHHDSCPIPVAPGLCSSMAACGVAITPADGFTHGATIRVASLVPSTPAGVHTGPTFAPELPPPRA